MNTLPCPDPTLCLRSELSHHLLSQHKTKIYIHVIHIFFLVWFRNRSISSGLEPVLSYTEKNMYQQVHFFWKRGRRYTTYLMSRAGERLLYTSNLSSWIIPVITKEQSPLRGGEVYTTYLMSRTGYRLLYTSNLSSWILTVITKGHSPVEGGGGGEYTTYLMSRT